MFRSPSVDMPSVAEFLVKLKEFGQDADEGGVGPTKQKARVGPPEALHPCDPPI